MLSGELVRLRERREEDETLLYDLAADLDTWELRRPEAPRPQTRAEFHQKFTEAPAPDATLFAITVDDRLVGRCDLFHEDTFARHAEVGIGLLPACRGRGYGTDALRVLVEFAFTRRNLGRVYLGTLATNSAALACYKKVGFVEEGRLRQHAWVRGEYVDEVVMGLLRSEWSRPLPR
jgi:RimJ/RimL family protein N-acetyltransferase